MSDKLTLEDMLKMELHGRASCGWCEVMRVPGGWIYWPCTPCPIFVPEPNGAECSNF